MRNNKNIINKNAPRVSIIILNWNNWKDTIECLESLYRIVYPNYDVILIDNGSKDCSIEKIKEYAEGKIGVNSEFFEYCSDNKPIKVFEIDEENAKLGKFNRNSYEKFNCNKRLILIKNKKNYGFVGGNNIGIKFALNVFDPDYILLLNNDTVVDKYFLTELIKAIENNKTIGMAGPKIYYYNYKGNKNVIHSAGGKFYPWRFPAKSIGEKRIDVGQYDNLRYVDFLSGACLLVRREFIEEVGLLNENYFAYWEEVEWALRGRKKGYVFVYVPTAKIWHKVGDPRKGNYGMRYYYLGRNRIYLLKETSKFWLIPFFIVFFIFDLWFIIGISAIYHRSFEEVVNFIRGVWEGVKYLVKEVNS